MRNKIPALLAVVGICCGFARGPGAITPVYQPDGTATPSGGTEFMNMVAHTDCAGPHLFGGTGYWLDTVQYNTQGAQIMRLDSSRGTMVQDIQFPAGVQIANSLAEFTLTADGSGNPISPPQKILLAGTKTINLTGAPGAVNANVYMRNDLNCTYAGTWTHFVISTPTVGATRSVQVRALGVHVDTVTGVQYVFAGTDPDPAGLAAIYPATFNNTTKALTFSGTPEFVLASAPVIGPQPPNLTYRVMGMVECNGAEYASIAYQLFKRIDGVSPTWVLAATESQLTQLPGNSVSGYRGLSCIPGSDGVTKKLVMTTEGGQAWVVAYDTPTLTETVEFKLTGFVNNALNLGIDAPNPPKNEVTYMICAYSHIDPVGFDPDYLIGCEIKLGIRGPPVYTTPMACSYTIPNEVSHYCAASYFHRKNDGTNYTWHNLPTSFPGSVAAYPTTAMRGSVASPFPGDVKVTYAYGFDANTNDQVQYILPSQPTAWVYRIQTLPGDVYP